MIRYSIKDLEKLSGIKAHTIRIWEKRYKLVEPARTSTNIRYYTDEDLKKLLNVSMLNRYGFRISNIVAMSPEELNRRLTNISLNESDYVIEVENMILCMIEMDESRFERILSSAVVKYGFEETMTGILHSFFEKIGILWQTGTITPAQEHFVTNLVRQKLIKTIDSLKSPVAINPKVFLLFLPEEEYHEIGLIFFHYLIKKHGHQVIYLGQNVPVADLKEIVSLRKVDFLFTSITCPMPGDSLQNMIHSLGTMFPDKTIFIGGSQIQQSTLCFPENYITLNTISELEEQLQHI